MIPLAGPLAPDPIDELRLLEVYHRTRSEEAFAQIVRLHHGWVYSVCRRALRDPHLAEDAAQAVFLVLARRAGSIPPEVRLSGWLFNACRFAISEARRGERRYRRRQDLAADRARESLRSLAAAREEEWETLAPLLEDAVASLGIREREAVLLHFYEGRTLREVGAVLGITRAGVKKRIGRAMEKLRQFMARKGINLSAPALATAMLARTSEAAPGGCAESVVSAVTGKALPSAPAQRLARAVLTSVRNSTLGLLKAILVGELLALLAAGVAVARSGPRLPASPSVRTALETAEFARPRLAAAPPLPITARASHPEAAGTLPPAPRTSPSLEIPLSAPYVSKDAATAESSPPPNSTDLQPTPPLQSEPARPARTRSNQTASHGVSAHSAPPVARLDPAVAVRPLTPAPARVGATAGASGAVTRSSLATATRIATGQAATGQADAARPEAPDRRGKPEKAGGRLTPTDGRPRIGRPDIHPAKWLGGGADPYLLQFEGEGGYLVRGNLSRILVQDGPRKRPLSDIVREEEGTVLALAGPDGTIQYHYSERGDQFQSLAALRKDDAALVQWHEGARQPRRFRQFYEDSELRAVAHETGEDGTPAWAYFPDVNTPAASLRRPIAEALVVISPVAVDPENMSAEGAGPVPLRSRSVPEPGAATILFTLTLLGRRRR